MQHAGVMPCLMSADRSFLFQHDNTLVRLAQRKLVGNGQPHDSPANDKRVAVGHGEWQRTYSTLSVLGLWLQSVLDVGVAVGFGKRKNAYLVNKSLACHGAGACAV